MIVFKIIGAIVAFWFLAAVAVILASVIVYGVIGLAG